MKPTLRPYISIWRFYLLTTTIFLGCRQDQQSYDTWKVYKGGSEANNYSSLDQINKDNVINLRPVWSFYPDDEPENFRFWKYECNPIVIGDIMYLTSAWRWLYAIQATTGERIWTFDPLQGSRGGGVLRGVTYWEGGGEERIFVSAGNKLFSVDARTGIADPAFGENGWISLDIVDGENPEARVQLSTPGIIYHDLLIVGAAVSENTGAAPGHVRAFDVRTGRQVWIFHTIPPPGEFGSDTWPDDAYKRIGGANNWAGMSLDEKRGIVYVPTGSPTYDYYGGDRPGANLFGNCILALNAATGAHIWHYQTVHHDIWDYDLPTAPNLITVEREGMRIDAIAQPSKTGFIYVLDRETGEPIFPIEERPVPPSKIPGEQAWPTQPFPTKPESFARQTMTDDDLARFTPEAYQENKKILNDLWFEGLFTPPDDPGTLLIPGSRGGGEWGGGAYDQVSGILYINSNESPEIGRMKRVRKREDNRNETLYSAGQKFYLTYCSTCHGADKKGIEANPSLTDIGERLQRSDILDKIRIGAGIMPSFATMLEGYEDEIMAFLTETGKNEPSLSQGSEPDSSSTYLNVTGHSYFLDSMGRPAIKPPWGTLNAINLHTGDFVWKIPLGNHPELQKPGEPPTGMENYGGPVVTAGGLVFIAATLDQMFRAFDKDTGTLLWEMKLPGNGLATPAVYSIEGRQYIAIAVSIGESLSHIKSGIICFSLPD
jgi:quinoprotein glucose dehydrogenase